MKRLKRILLTVITVMLTFFTASMGNTVYEDAEDGSTSRWSIYDNDPVGAAITNVYDNDRASRVIQFSGDGMNNGYALGGTWNNTQEKMISWSMKYNEDFMLYISVQTQNGHRYLTYTDSEEDWGLIGTYIYYGLSSTAASGTWQTITRDLEADIEIYEPGNTLLAVNGFLIRGSGLIDDIEMVSDGGAADSTAPVITLTGPNPQTIEAGTAYTELGATASDNVDGDISASIIIDASAVNTAVPESYSVTYNVSDAAGNAAVQVTRTVNVIDTTAPVIMLTGVNPQIIEEGTAYTELGATASDNVDGDISANIDIDTSDVNINVVGNYVVTYNVSDAAGNAAITVSRVVNVIDSTVPDTTAPIITLTGANPQTIEAGTAYTELGATASDNVDGDISASIIIDASAVNTAVPESYSVTYNVSDAAGNAAITVSRVVNVVDSTVLDTTAPVISLLGTNPMEVIQGDAFIDPGATASDETDGSVTVLSSGSVDTSTVGTYTRTYTATDNAGNTATKTRTVNVVSDGGAGQGTVYEDAEDGSTSRWSIYDNDPVGAAITNVYDNDRASRVIQFSGDGMNNGYALGGTWNNTQEKMISWSMKYSEGFTVYVSVETQNGHRYLTYIDSEEDWGLIGTYIYYGLGSTAASGTWQTITRDLEADIEIYEPGNTLLAVNGFLIRGSGLIDDIEMVSDGGAADSTAPVITLTGPNPQTIEAGTAYTELGATASDNVDGDISASIIIDASAVNTAVPESYSVTYNVSDAAGNAAVQVTRTVNVVEGAQNIAPVAHAGPDQIIRGVGSVVTLNGSSSTDENGDDLSYSWVLTRPTGSAATLSDAHIVNPTFTPDVNGNYILQLRVNDGSLDSVVDTVAILYSSTVEYLNGGGICLSFDDDYVPSWYSARSLFDQYNAKVTFSLSWFDYLAPVNIDKLLELKSDGHEIASHSFNHLDINGVLTEGGYGAASEVERYIREEIDPSIEHMAAAGLPPVTFAVPFNAENDPYIDALLKKFSFVRGGAWVGGNDITTVESGYYTCTDHFDNRRYVHGFAGSESIENLNAAMEHAAATNSVVLIYDHEILENDGPYGITRAKLEAILSKAQELGLKFYTRIELLKHCD